MAWPRSQSQQDSRQQPSPLHGKFWWILKKRHFSSSFLQKAKKGTNCQEISFLQNSPAFQPLAHRIYMLSHKPWDTYYYSHFRDEENEAKRGPIPWQKEQSQDPKWGKLAPGTTSWTTALLLFSQLFLAKHSHSLMTCNHLASSSPELANWTIIYL